MTGGRSMEGCGQCLKYMLFLANFLILIGGVVLMSVGIWTVSDKTHFEQLLGTDLYVSAAYILIFTGVVVVIIAFLGCFGAVKEIRCMLITYFIILLVLFVVLLVGGILGYVFRERVEDTITARMMASLSEYTDNQAIRDAWDAAQSQVPEQTCSASRAYDAGCQNRVKVFVQDHAQVIGGVGVGIACLMLIGMFFSLAVFKAIE